MVRYDPYLSNSFFVEVDGLLVGAFREVSGGLSVEIAIDEVEEGGTEFTHQLPRNQIKYEPIVLKHGMSDLDFLWAWYSDFVSGDITRQSGSIYLLNSELYPVMWWEFYDAFPFKWEGPDLSADGNSAAVETIHIAHHGITKPVPSLTWSAALATAKLVNSL